MKFRFFKLRFFSKSTACLLIVLSHGHLQEALKTKVQQSVPKPRPLPTRRKHLQLTLRKKAESYVSEVLNHTWHEMSIAVIYNSSTLFVPSVLVEKEIPAITGRLTTMKWFSSPGSAQGLLAQFTKGSGMVRFHLFQSINDWICETLVKIKPFTVLNVSGDVAVKVLKVTNPTPEQFQAFRNEVAVLR